PAADAFDDGIVVAGDEPISIAAERRDANRPEVLVAERTWPAGLLRLEVDGLLANLEQRPDHRRTGARRWPLQDRRAAFQEGGEGIVVIVVDPAIDLGPGGGLVLRTG